MSEDWNRNCEEQPEPTDRKLMRYRLEVTAIYADLYRKEEIERSTSGYYPDKYTYRNVPMEGPSHLHERSVYSQELPEGFDLSDLARYLNTGKAEK